MIINRKEKMDLSALGDLEKLAKQMGSAYGDGVDAMGKAGKVVAKDMRADHEILLDIQLSATIEGHEYMVDADILFDIELNAVLESASSPMGDLSSLLDGLGVDMGDDKDAVMEQLGQPRAVGVVKKIDTKKLQVSTSKGKAKIELNKDGTLLATIKDGKILINCESVFSFPKNPDLFVAIPSMEQMQENMQIDIKDMNEKTSFSWVEKDKDNLSVNGTVLLRKK